MLMENIFLMGAEISRPKNLSTKNYLLFYPTEGYHITEVQHSLFVKHLEALNLLENVSGMDIEFMSAGVKTNADELRKVAGFSYQDYKDTQLIFENCIFDEKLRWTICVYQDYWGIVYGENELIRRLSADYDFEQDAQRFESELIAEIMDEKSRREYETLIKLSYVRVKQ